MVGLYASPTTRGDISFVLHNLLLHTCYAFYNCRLLSDRLQEWPLFIPKFPKKEHVYLKLEYPERMEHFVDEFPLTYEDSFVFFHSDKPIYKVHETVRLRATRLSRSLDFIEGDCKISILVRAIRLVGILILFE